jgi:hypothetical protein
MASVDIQTDDFSVWYEPESATVFMKGFLRLAGIPEYQPIMTLLLSVLEQSSRLTLDLRDLEFLNSSGISMLSMFVVKARNQGNLQLIFQGSNTVLWQTKSLRNLQRLMPSLDLEFS